MAAPGSWDRRSLLRRGAAGAAAGLAAGLAAPAVQGAAPRTALLLPARPEDAPGALGAARRLAARVALVSDGRLAIDTAPPDRGGASSDIFGAVASGAAQMYLAPEDLWRDRHPGFAFFGAVPMGLTAAEHEAWIAFGGGAELWQALGAEFGLTAFAAGQAAMRPMGWFRTPLAGPEDLAGLRIRMAGLGGAVLAALGARVSALSGPALLAAVVAGALDAVDWSGPAGDLRLGLHLHLGHLHVPGFQAPSRALALGVNRAWLAGLEPGLRAAIEHAARAEAALSRARALDRMAIALGAIEGLHGIAAAPLPAALWPRLAAASEAVLDDSVAADPLARRIHASHRRFRRETGGWSRLSVAGYLEARAALPRRRERP